MGISGPYSLAYIALINIAAIGHIADKMWRKLPEDHAQYIIIDFLQSNGILRVLDYRSLSLINLNSNIALTRLKSQQLIITKFKEPLELIHV